ncbi:MAG TPA: hypothetical protein VMT75_04815 [Candidatus Saccharimonadales bacterium]|nr:hypothetical protein [Candidatus Saccharimonadales bacterium]
MRLAACKSSVFLDMNLALSLHFFQADIAPETKTASLRPWTDFDQAEVKQRNQEIAMNKRSFVLGFCMSLLFGSFPAAVTAQSPAPAASTTSLKGTKTETPATPEITVVGSIQKVLEAGPKGAPKGTYVVVAGPQGTISANLGPWLNAGVKQSLAVGQPMQLTGNFRTYQGQNYLMARQVTVNNQLLTIRNEHGSLARKPTATAKSRQQNNLDAKGDNQ